LSGKNWAVIELEVGDEFRTALAADGLEPFILNEAEIVLCSAGHWEPGYWVCPTFRRSSEHDHLFIAQETAYLLLGPRRSIKATAQAVMAIKGSAV
jgi:hypothetical protein